jgi:hypothetical protein
VILQALAALLALSVASSGWLYWRLDAAQDELKEVKAGIVAAALAYSEAARKTEQQHAERIAHAQRTREQEVSRSRRAADLLRVERDGLRNEIAAFATGPADDTGPACRERATALGALLDDALRTAAACAAGAEQHASDVRALQGAWPVTNTKD